MTATRTAGLVVLLGSFLLAFDAIGQQRAPYPPQPKADASKPAMEKVTKARAEVTKAQAVTGQIAAKIREQAETSDEWKAASAEQKQAQADTDAARKRVLDAVHESAAYKQAVVAIGFDEAEVLVAYLGCPGGEILAGTFVVGLHFDDLAYLDGANAFFCFEQWAGAGCATGIDNFVGG